MNKVSGKLIKSNEENLMKFAGMLNNKEAKKIEKEIYEERKQKITNSKEEKLLHDLLMSEEGTITIDEARRRLNKKWPRSK